MAINAPAHLLKRVRRHLSGPVHELFAVVSPGLEAVCARELQAAPIAATDVRPIVGGVAFRGRLTDLMGANLHLRTANRILMRLTCFHAANFRQLARQAGAFPWELYLPSGIAPLVQVASHRSRLHHRGAVAEHLSAAIAARVGEFGTSPSEKGGPDRAHRLMVRVEDDRFTISLDSSGALLHKRGLKSHPGRAPLRETLAAAVLEMAGYDPQRPLLDPMCGSGTFTLEAAMRTRNIAPGSKREFAFFDWPAFSPGAWEHLQRKAEARILPFPATPFIRAADRDAAACESLQGCLQRHALDKAASVAVDDFFTLHPASAFDRPGLVVLNPPYGRRLDRKGDQRLVLEAIARRMTVAYGGWRFALLFPASGISAFPLPARTFSLIHGGLPLAVLCGTIA
jgi:putative N6-adenine-specific DNA methylase